MGIAKVKKAVQQTTGDVAVVDEAAAALAAYVESHKSAEAGVAPQRWRPPAAVVHCALKAWALAKQADAIDAQLKDAKADLARVLDGESLVVPGVVRASVARTSSAGVADADKLRALLGERFDDLVVKTESYKPSEALQAMASDGDDPMAPAYRALLKVRTTLVVRLTAEK